MERISKQDARAFGRDARAGMDADQRRAASVSIAQRCRETLPWHDEMSIHIFMSIARNLEIDTSPLLAWIFSAWPTARVYAPRETSIMMHAQIFLDTEYAVNRLGIPEPPAQNVAQITNFDLIFVPLLAFDSAGHRVGYGGGYYDRFLAGQAKAFKVGLAYESSRLSRIIDADIHDVALDRVITETKMHRFA